MGCHVGHRYSPDSLPRRRAAPSRGRCGPRCASLARPRRAHATDRRAGRAARTAPLGAQMFRRPGRSRRRAPGRARAHRVRDAAPPRRSVASQGRSRHDDAERSETPRSRSCSSSSSATRGFDFTGYKRSSSSAASPSAWRASGVERYADYLDYLEVAPARSSTQLFNTILINVTGFFRDPPAWESPARARSSRSCSRHGRRTSRSACGARAARRARRPYTLAMVLAEALGRRGVPRAREDLRDRRRRGGARPRRATAPTRQGRSRTCPRDALERYFERADQRYVFRKDLRRAVIFGRNDLVQDAPISRIDLLVCRNTLMYFNAETQARILRRFHFALDDDGVLFLGKSEMLITHARPVRAGRPQAAGLPQGGPADAARSRAASWPTTAPSGRRPIDGRQPARGGVRRRRRARSSSSTHGPARCMANDAARAAVRPRRRATSAGRSRTSSSPTARSSCARHSSALRRATARPSRSSGSSGGAGGDDRACSTSDVAPLRRRDGAPIGAEHRVRRRHRRSPRSQDRARALQARARARPTRSCSRPIEELETTNEELQSTNEELETTNEELQSTNEELETMNEELQSTNEELETINEELRQRTERAQRRQRLPRGDPRRRIGLAVAVLDRDQRVQIWNGAGARSCGACAPTRPRASTCSASTSACRSSSCGRCCSPPVRARTVSR